MQQVLYGDGTSCSDPQVHPVVVMLSNPTPPAVPAKTVDLDSEQQSVSELWGFTVALGQLNAVPTFAGDFAVAAFADLAGRVVGGDSVLGAAYQSVPQGVKWGDTNS